MSEILWNIIPCILITALLIVMAGIIVRLPSARKAKKNEWVYKGLPNKIFWVATVVLVIFTLTLAVTSIVQWWEFSEEPEVWVVLIVLAIVALGGSLGSGGSAVYDIIVFWRRR